MPVAEAEKRAVVAWALARMPPGIDLGPVEPLAVVDEGQIKAAALYSGFRALPYGHTIEVSFATSGPGWESKGVLRALFHYPFVQQNCIRMTAWTGKGNKKARDLLEGLGFSLEGKHPLAYDGRQAALTYGMARESCRWLVSDGQEHSFSARAA